MQPLTQQEIQSLIFRNRAQSARFLFTALKPRPACLSQAQFEEAEAPPTICNKAAFALKTKGKS
jgi:hypothetical protein